MKRKLLLRAVLYLIAMPTFLFAQDARFSQYFNNPLILNPAFAGNGIENIRVTAIYRNQWAGMGTPFTTQGFAVDKVVNRIGIGAAITRNGAGDASIKTLNFVGNLSYHMPIGYYKINTLSAGVQVGIVNKSFDPSKLTFDNQFNPDAGYDPNISSGEEFTNTSVTRPDLNAGLSWQRGWLNKEVRFKPFLSAAYSHINKPEETFIEDATKSLAKTTFYGGFGYLIRENIELRPTFMQLNQGPHKESTFGTLVNYQFDNKNAVQLGAYHRMNDAVIAYAGYQMNLLFVGMSYDVNTSELSSSGKGNNAFEISLTYSPRPRKPKEPKPKPEPTVKLERVESEVSTMESITATLPTLELPETLASREIFAPTVEPIQEVVPVVVAPVAEVITEIVKPVDPTPAVITDSDQDGLNDTEDECPFIKGSPALRGCPDSDSDGLIDMKDDCPMESGPATNKGCPDPNKPIVKNNQELVKKFDNILFASGRTSMTTDDIFDIIERAIDILYADKSTKVLLSGHTDSEGNAYQNMILSQSRTEVVKAYLIKQGIDETRIETIPYGETMPLENNTSFEGKKLNRRVEINILKK